MCTIVFMPDGEEIESFDGEDTCMCQKSESEILAYTIKKLSPLQWGERIVIELDPLGYNITIEKKAEEPIE